MSVGSSTGALWGESSSQYAPSANPELPTDPSTDSESSETSSFVSTSEDWVPLGREAVSAGG
eukprot:15347822-Ditylum_brightwellii.AAC.1